MPDTKRKRELTYTAAVERLRALKDEEADAIHYAQRAAGLRQAQRYAEKFAAVLARVPEKVRAAVAEEAGVAMPEDDAEPPRERLPSAHIPVALAGAREADVDTDDAEPVYTAERMQTELSPERKKIAGMK